MSASKFVYVTYIRTTAEKLWRAIIEPGAPGPDFRTWDTTNLNQPSFLFKYHAENYHPFLQTMEEKKRNE